MQYITHYHSPLGKITLAADKTGLTGLWFEGQKYFALHLEPEHEEKSCRSLPMQNDGWIFIFPAENRIFHCRCISQEVIFKMRYGEFFLPFLMVRPQPMVKLQNSWLKGERFPECQRRQWEGP